MSLTKHKKNLTVGTVGFHMGTQDELAELIETFPIPESGAYVSFVGAPHVALAAKDSGISSAYRQAAIVCADGIPIVRLARKMNLPCERCAGPDMMLRILTDGLERGDRHFFYGTSQDVLQALTEKLKQDYPTLQIAGTYSPPFRPLLPEEDEEIVAEIRKSGADYVWVALGSPKQDFWMQAHAAALPHCKLMGVGAAFNFLSGRVKRAPAAWQKLGLEWLYRLLKEPTHLWKRYFLIAPKFFIERRKTLKNWKKQQKAEQVNLPISTIQESEPPELRKTEKEYAHHR